MPRPLTAREYKMSVPFKILELTERFQSNLEAYKQGKYNETQVRREFIDPFFEELGWDIANKQGHSEAYKEVVHEDAIRVERATKAPDYCFRIGGIRKFFLEAKKPAVNIREDISPAYQLRRYAWSAKLPLSILTDFEEFAVYDCRFKPVKTDQPSHSRIMYLKYTDYHDKWDEITGIFSKDAILKGSFDKYVESKKAKHGTAEVDAAFLEEIERWRDHLAKNIALRNTALTQRELNFAVQSTIDRIIFLRICEDRGIESYGRLMALENGNNIYERLFILFRQADDRYNSGIFHFRPEKDRPGDYDTLTPLLAIDDTVLKDIFKNLYYPDSPYEFSVLPADILGQVYEQFLGKVIRLTEGHRAKVEEKPEVRKAGGVYYTPTYIVDYIVQKTVGRLLEGKKVGPRGNSESIKILDPACGSGSFLLGAYQCLLDWHRESYVKDNPEKWAKGRNPRLCRGPRGEWRLTTTERKRILLNSIYGVDIDPQAVEVTKLSLLLKVLELEDEQSITRQLSFFHERALPDLANNIKCGNSLIGPDFYNGSQLSLLDKDEIYRINAFDWNKEFPEIMAGGGFDAVIGNPPYGGIFNSEENKYISKIFKVFGSIQDAYVGFIEKAHYIIRQNGFFGFIVPSAWLGGPRYKNLRTFLLKFSIETIILLPFNIFKDAYIDTVIITTCNKSIIKDHTTITYEYPKKYKISSIDLLSLTVSKINQCLWSEIDDIKFILNIGIIKVISKIRNSTHFKFGDFISMKRGVLFNKNLLTKDKTGILSHLYFEGDVYRYFLNYNANMWVEYGEKMIEFPKEFFWFEGERILLRRLVNRKYRLMATTIDRTVITDKNLYIIKPSSQESLFFILGILNSRLFSKLYISQVSQASKDDFPQVTIRDILSLPFPIINYSNKNNKQCYDQLIILVKRILYLNNQLSESKIPQEREVLQRQIETTDNQIDRLIYDLYGLTDEEIEIVEQSLKD